VPVVLGAIWFLQQKRNVGFVDSQDTSTAYRTMVWREGFGVLVSSPRHLAVGIGMDSLMKHWQDWHMFGNGFYPLSHLHSTPLMIAFERGVPTLIAWLAWMFFYLRMLWRTLRRPGLRWFERGVVIGAIGGTIGFLASSIVHFNWGDEEVVMIFYIIMGITMAINRLSEEGDEQESPARRVSEPLTA
jgi:O-antigen ligase